MAVGPLPLLGYEKELEMIKCNFCGKDIEKIKKMVSSPGDMKKVYICDECIQVCVAILVDPEVTTVDEVIKNIAKLPIYVVDYLNINVWPVSSGADKRLRELR